MRSPFGAKANRKAGIRGDCPISGRFEAFPRGFEAFPRGFEAFRKGFEDDLKALESLRKGLERLQKAFEELRNVFEGYPHLFSQPALWLGHRFEQLSDHLIGIDFLGLGLKIQQHAMAQNRRRHCAHVFA